MSYGSLNTEVIHTGALSIHFDVKLMDVQLYGCSRKTTCRVEWPNITGCTRKGEGNRTVIERSADVVLENVCRFVPGVYSVDGTSDLEGRGYYR